MSYQFRTQPYSHQARVFAQSSDLPSFAILWEQGTGKTKLAIDTAGKLYREGKINGVVIIAPPGVHRNWITDELPVHLPEDIAAESEILVWDADKRTNKSFLAQADATLAAKGLAWATFSFNNFVTDSAKKWAKKFLLKRRCLFLVDEAHNIKEPSTTRTRTIIAAGKYAPFRRIMTGTPVAQGPLDLYSQMRFVDETIWKNELGIDSYSVFKHHFAEWFEQRNGQGQKYEQLVCYKNLDELAAILDKYGSRVLKEDVLDLPPKLYSKMTVELSKEQQNLYKSIRDEYMAEMDGGVQIDAPLAIVRLLRLQQICCGYIQAEPGAPILPIGKSNPRLDLAVEVLIGLSGQAIVWARFSEDIDQLMKALGKKAVRYDGKISEDFCERSKNAFKAGDAQFFVANQQKGATGLTLNEADTVLYYSNSFKLVDRLQSEDRCHRAGQTKSVQYIDLIAAKTVDEHIVKSLRNKLDIASAITGDELKEWL